MAIIDDGKFYSLDSEMAWLGTCVNFKDDYKNGVEKGVTKETFYDNNSQRLYVFISKCHDNFESFDDSATIEKLQVQDLETFFNDCTRRAASADIEGHLQKLLELQKKREIFQIIQIAYNTGDIDELPTRLRPYIKDETKYGKDVIEKNHFDFPKEVLYGVAGNFAKIYSSYLESPDTFFYFSYLTCLGSILSHKLTLNTELKPQPRLFVVLLGESADDRKSTAIAKTVDFFRKTMQEFPICHGIGSAEGLQKMLEKDKGLLLCFDELKQFISKCKIESSVLLPCVNTLFESNCYSNHTKSSDLKINDAFLSVLAASTVPTYEKVWDSSFLDIGFVNRIFIIPDSGEKKHSLPIVIPDTEKKELIDQTIQILRLVREPIVLNIDDDAKVYFHKWYMKLEQSVHAKRLDTYAMRFMALLAVNEFKNKVDIDVVTKVCALMDWQLSVRRIHDPIDAESGIARMEEKIRRAVSTGQLQDRELKQKTHANRSGIWIFTTARDNLVKAKEIQWNKISRKWEAI